MTLIFACLSVGTCYADTLTLEGEESDITEGGVIAIANQYNLEYKIYDESDSDVEITDIISLKQLQNAIITGREQSSDVEDPIISIQGSGVVTDENSGSVTAKNSLTNYSLISYPIATLIRRSSYTGGLTINYSVSGTYKTVSGVKQWVNVTGTDIKPSNGPFTKVEYVSKKIGSKSSDSKKITRSYSIRLGHYIGVKIPGTSKVIGVRVSCQNLNGEQYFWASSI
ncbi:hypothetical protein [Clostridium sp.]|uniref:hypothetical protein n=1 Tax=Clostridium sp. TaxID=1506 RepID=UPI0032171D25